VSKKYHQVLSNNVWVKAMLAPYLLRVRRVLGLGLVWGSDGTRSTIFVAQVGSAIFGFGLGLETSIVTWISSEIGGRNQRLTPCKTWAYPLTLSHPSSKNSVKYLGKRALFLLAKASNWRSNVNLKYCSRLYKIILQITNKIFFFKYCTAPVC